MAADPPVESSGEALAGALTELETLLREVVENPAGLVPVDLEGYLEPAWRDVRLLFDPAREALLEIEETELAQAGLTGAQLTLKLRAAGWGVQRARDLMAQVPRLPGEAAAALAHACGLVDVILKSLPIPQLTEPIAEFKGVVERLAATVAFVVEGH